MTCITSITLLYTCTKKVDLFLFIIVCPANTQVEWGGQRSWWLSISLSGGGPATLIRDLQGDGFEEQLLPPLFFLLLLLSHRTSTATTSSIEAVYHLLRSSIRTDSPGNSTRKCLPNKSSSNKSRALSPCPSSLPRQAVFKFSNLYVYQQTSTLFPAMLSLSIVYHRLFIYTSPSC